jgi:hypothetical protein
VTWAQRSSSSDPVKNHVFLTIVASDVPEKDLKLDLQPTKLSFKGTSTSKKVTYAVDLEFYDEIDPKESKIINTGRDIELVLRKKELKEEYWPRLLKESKKMHFLKTDFDKVRCYHRFTAFLRLGYASRCRTKLTHRSGLMRTSKTSSPTTRTTCPR